MGGGRWGLWVCDRNHDWRIALMQRLKIENVHRPWAGEANRLLLSVECEVKGQGSLPHETRSHGR